MAPTSSAPPLSRIYESALDLVQIDDMVGQHETHVEHGHQRLPAGQQLGVLQAVEQPDDIADGARIVVAKGRRFHADADQVADGGLGG